VKPASHRTLPISAVPKEGWSTYASPVTRMISNCRIPSFSPSLPDRGRNMGWCVIRERKQVDKQTENKKEPS
jgi:hypothetical protein